MACSLIALDKRQGVHPVGIGETLRQAIAKLVMRASGDQAKTAGMSLQLCAGLEAGIEGETHAMAQRRRDRKMPAPEGRSEEESEDGRIPAAEDADMDGVVVAVGGVGEVPEPPGGTHGT